jgi:Flp pilus assembly protein TadG
MERACPCGDCSDLGTDSARCLEIAMKAMRHILGKARSTFRRNDKGAVTMIFSLSAVILLATVGLAVDYTNVSRAREQLNSAADAAVLSAVSKVAMNNFPGSDNGVAAAKADFMAQANAGKTVTVNSVNLSVVQTGVVVSATLNYSATIQNTFGPLVKVPTWTFAGSAQATTKIPAYVDFYLLLDNSPSMGVAATTADIAKMQTLTASMSQGSCAFGCHQQNANGTDNLNDYYHVAKNNGVTMRIDVLRTATQSLTTTAMQTESLPNQFRMGVYEFAYDGKLPTNSNPTLTTIQSLTSNLTGVQSAANAIDLAYSYQDQRDDQSSFDFALPAINAVMTDPGNGTSQSPGPNAPQAFLFFVTDGAEDEPGTAYGKAGNTGQGNRVIDAINPSLCTTIKNRGITIAVLYTTYLPLPSNAYYNAHIAPISNTIQSNLQQCASPGFFWSVSPSQGIADAMNAMFQAAVAKSRLTH